MSATPDVVATHKDIQLVLQRIQTIAESFQDWKDVRKTDHDTLTRIDTHIGGVCRDMAESQERIQKLEQTKAERSEVVALSDEVKRLSTSIDKLGQRLEEAIRGAQGSGLKGSVASGASGGGVLGLIITALYLYAKSQGWF